MKHNKNHHNNNSNRVRYGDREYRVHGDAEGRGRTAYEARVVRSAAALDRMYPEGSPRSNVGRVIRWGAALAATGALVAPVAANAEKSNTNRLMVDTEVIADLSPEEIADTYDTLRVAPGSNISELSHEYAEAHGLRTKHVRESLVAQARQHDIDAGRPMNAHIVQPSEVFYMPLRSDGQK